MIVEEVKLPSQGLIYNGRLGDVVKVRPFTTREYKDLIVSSTTSNVNKLIDSCLQDCPLKSKEFCSADKLAIMFKIRSITLGSKVSTPNTCPYCSVKKDIEWDLNDLTVQYLNIDEYPIKLVLPSSGKKLSLLIPTEELNERAAKLAATRSQKYDLSESGLLSVLNTTILLIPTDCSNDPVSVMEWYEKLPVEDALFLDQAISDSQNFGVEVISTVNCSQCGNDFRAILNTQDSLFRPKKPGREVIQTIKGTLGNGPEAANASE